MNWFIRSTTIACWAALSCVAYSCAEESVDELSSKVDEIHNRFAISRIFDRHGAYGQAQGLDLTLDQMEIFRDLRTKRFALQDEDLNECEFITADPTPGAVETFLRQVRQRELKREASDLEVVQETLLEFQHERLGKLLIREKGLDALGTPFVQKVLPLSQRQIRQLSDLQRRMNAEFGRVVDAHPGDGEAITREIRKLAPMCFEICEIMRTDQLEEYFKLKGQIKDGQTLESWVETLPADVRTVCEKALANKGKAKERQARQ